MSKPTDELKSEANGVGLTKLKGRHWDELQKALDAKQKHTSGMPDGLSIWDEPAHVYRAGEEA
ncbi:MAG: hypothetical protein VX430_06645 [Pseudomonadota bacterium]|nr:hypothetical protein [Pseudomonadota bacterium]